MSKITPVARVVRDPVTGRFVSIKGHEEKEELITWQWAVTLVAAIITLLCLAWIFSMSPRLVVAEPAPIYIVVQEEPDTYGSGLVVAEPATASKEKTPAVKPGPEKREIIIYRNGQYSETVTVD